jgi:chemosensory pili system protein ChpA (sensor histidine kinase/response regulator)
MTRTVSREVLQGFIEEAESYLPTIVKLVDVIKANPKQAEALEESHRLVHTIKGASAMVGLAGLSHIAFNVEEALEEIAAGQLAMDNETAALIRETIAQIKNYLSSVWAGSLNEKPILTEVTLAFRRLRGLPEIEDATVIQQVLDKVAKETAPIPTDPQSTPPPQTTAPASQVSLESLRYDDSSPELVEAFTTEAEDHLRQVGTNLTELENQPGNRNLVQSIRRSVHTLKGAAGAVGFRAVSQLSHRMEDMLDQLYEGGMTITPDTMQLLFNSSDALEDLLSGAFVDDEMQTRIQNLYARYTTALANTSHIEPETPQVTFQKPEPLPDERTLDLASLEPSDAEKIERPAPTAPRLSGQVVRAPIERLDELVRLVSEVAITRTTLEQRMSDFGRMVEDLRASGERLRRVSNNIEIQFEASTLGGGRLMQPIPGTNPISPKFSEFDALEMDRYTEFHRLRRELTETTTDIRTVGGELATLVGDLDSVLVRQGRLSSELQDKLMRVRMVPLATLATRLHRAVRTVAADQGKSVDLVLQGEHIELDKTVLEEMADPLLHLLRNAVDHGIEPPALRQVMGKTERGTIILKASHEGNQVVIQVSDDGAGLEPQMLRTSAVNGGYVAETDAAKMSDEELFSLIFVPGFSTSKEISEVSGRGVGLDIVKANVNKLKGTVSVKSEPGKGARFTIRLPMTLAVMRALLVKSNSETFAIPQSSVAQILRVERKEIEAVGQEPIIRVGGRVYPVHRLGDLMKLKQPADESLDRVPVLILNTGTEQIALVVDQLLTGREIVIKTLGNHLRRVHGITGATLMGDGTVVLIVNPLDLLTEPEADLRLPTQVHIPSRAPINTHKAWSVMIVDDSVSVRRVVGNLIRRAGWQPVLAKDGLEALEIIQRTTELPDLILLDIEMPRMDGFELMGTLKAQEAYRTIPIAMLTSRAGDKHRRKAMELGASEYIVKPYQDDALLNMIRNCIIESKRAIPA